MKFEIKHRFSGSILFSVETESLKVALQLAITSRANLYGADLSRANLSGADLSRANLYGANLYGADLSRANLYGADLYGADLSRANLYGANLYGANLYGANLYGANLYGADLSRANLSGADLSGANLSGAKNAALVLARLRITPEGDLVGWKKLREGRIAKLLIPAAAKRLNAYTSRKCRAEFAMCVEIVGPKGGQHSSGSSMHDSRFTYEVGKQVTPTSFDSDVAVECSAGIHFFITREEAEAYE